MQGLEYRSPVRRVSALALPVSAALILLPSTIRPLAAQEASTDVEAASAAATKWLALIDAGEYEASWTQAASGFQDAVTPAVWTESVTNARGSLEPFGDRELISSQQVTDPPGAPPGDYVILQYRTDVAGDRTAVETVVPMREGDAWKVSGYFVNPE